MRTAILNRTYRNALGNCQARANVTGTDALRKQLADAFFPARHVVRHRGVPACLVMLRGDVAIKSRLSQQAKLSGGSAARMLESISSSMSGPQRWAAERRLPRAFVTSA